MTREERDRLLALYDRFLRDAQDYMSMGIAPQMYDAPEYRAGIAHGLARASADLHVAIRALLAADEGGDALSPLTSRWPIQYTRATRTDGPAWSLEWRRVYGGGAISDERVVGPAPTLAECVSDAVAWEAENDRREPQHAHRTASPQPASESLVGDCGVATRRLANPASASEVACPECAEMREALRLVEPILSAATAGLYDEIATVNALSIVRRALSSRDTDAKEPR